ncbi:MAG: phospholipase D family protein [Bacteroidetes bacterium]|nr:phospholipase D family protein [Bacteroidota bacterium]
MPKKKFKKHTNKKNDKIIYILFFSLGIFLGSKIFSYSSKISYKINNDDIEIDIRFSPKGGCNELARKSILKAKKYILVQAYYFTCNILAEELTKAYQRGVDIKILMDKSQLTHKHSKLKYFKKYGIEIYIDSVSGLSHNKVMIIDDLYVLTGSFNWTTSAEKRNSENLLLIKSKKVAQIYKNNWYSRKSKAKEI